LWRRLRVHMSERPAGWDEPHPLDRFVGSILARADAALAAAGVAYRRFEPTVDAEPRMHFAAMGRLVGLGSPGPFGMLIHPEHGPWWALRGAWLVRADVDEPPAHREPCAGCAAPCVGGWQNACDVGLATAEARARCVVGQGSRYDPDQIAYHHDHASALARLRRR
ncbi:MAG TPA: hypothetical protein VE987_09800, partial [Polyangiaceae bacterium]|nr:hypothetical protein [Polyangiaceae bacterium]